MADFSQELSKLMGLHSPTGGFGIQNLGAFQDLLRRDSAQGLRRAQFRDQDQLQRQGLGRSVAGAFSGGTRQNQFSQSLMDALTKLQGTHSQMAEGQRQSLMGLLAPQATARANRPSFLSSLLGGVGGMAAQVGVGALTGGMGGGLAAMIAKMMAGSPAGQGMANTGNMGFNFGGLK